jgi:hypothetical protein
MKLNLLADATWVGDHIVGIVATVITTVVTVAASWRASWRVLAERRAAEIKDLRAIIDEKNRELVPLRRECRQLQEFTLQDRHMKDLHADEIMRLCATVGENAAELLHAIRLKVRTASMRRLLTDAIHSTDSTAGECDP